ncbi:MAG: NAD(P)-dependent oxidoreductase [Lachnospiraceae bacterium]|nr:NAD(P)-dependent oxidoreductase [Lachnospiraceae bacterium]
MRNVIVTGGAGFFGANLVGRMSEKGYGLTVVVRPGSEHNKRFEEYYGTGITLIENDTGEIEKLPDKLNEIYGKTLPQYDTFYHLAWSGGRNDSEAQLKNVSDTMKALETAAGLGCKRFICSGSQAEYGLTGDVIIDEDTDLNPVSAYGAAKIAACFMTRIRAKELCVEWIWGRIFSLIGRYEPRGRMLPDLIDSLRRGEQARLSSCDQYWDYLDAEDAADAFIALGEKGVSGEIYNIANGDYHRLKHFTETVKRRFNPEAAIVYGDAPDPYISLRPSIEKIKRDAGWSPRISFEESLGKY